MVWLWGARLQRAGDPMRGKIRAFLDWLNPQGAAERHDRQAREERLRASLRAGGGRPSSQPRATSRVTPPRSSRSSSGGGYSSPYSSGAYDSGSYSGGYDSGGSSSSSGGSSCDSGSSSSGGDCGGF